VTRLLRSESGATAIEYAMIAAGIAMAVITAVNTLGQDVKTVFFDKIVAGL
jgi:pilus assembly protein Flp/PilA